MQFSSSIHIACARAGSYALILLLLVGARPASATVFRSWASGVSGSAADATKWNPAGIPAAADYLSFNPPGSYSVTFSAGVPASTLMSVDQGTVTFLIDSPHTTQELLIGANFGLITLNHAHGTMNADYLNLGYPGSQSRLSLLGNLFTGTAALNTKSMGNRYFGGLGGDIIGYGGIAHLDIFEGAQYTCDRAASGSWPLQVGMQPGAVGNITIAGFSGLTAKYSGLHVTGSELGEGLVLGVQGIANFFAYDGGHVDVAGRVVLGQLSGSSGYATIGPASGAATSSLDAHTDLWIGHNFYGELLAGHGELTIKDRGFVRVAQRCDVGDPDNDTSSFLRVDQGATFRTNGGLRVWPVSGAGLDLRGGMTHVRGGAFQWPAGKFLSISSQVGTPTLAISSGVASTGPNTPAFNSQLFVGRNGAGTLRITQPGTVFTMGVGATTIGESAGGVGMVVVDSLAHVSTTGPFNVAVSGAGELDVLGASAIDMGNLSIGVGGGSNGQVSVRGDGSIIRANDRLYIGGGFGGAGGTGALSIEAAGVVSVPQVSAVNPALITVYPSTGSIRVAEAGLLTTPGMLDNRGTITVLDGEIRAQTFNMPATGQLDGHGLLISGMITNGTIDPHEQSTSVGTLQINGNVQQFGASRYVANIGEPSAARCDLLDIRGNVALDGTLDLRTPPGFVGVPGDVFTILTCTSRTGSYAAVTWNGAALSGQANIVYGSNTVWVVIPGVPTGVDPGAGPGSSVLSFAPMGGATKLGFALDLPAAADVQVKVYDVRGREAVKLFTGALNPGRHQLQVPATDAGRLPSGVYFARAVIRAGGQTQVRVARTVIVR